MLSSEDDANHNENTIESCTTKINHAELEDLRPQATESITMDATNTEGSLLLLKRNRSAEYRGRHQERRQTTAISDSSTECDFAQSRITDAESRVSDSEHSSSGSETGVSADSCFG